MSLTHLNALINTSYPFRPGQDLPFSNALVTGLTVTLVYDTQVYTAMAVSVSAVRVTGAAVCVALTATYKLNGVTGTRYIGEASCNFVSKLSTYESAVDDIFGSFAVVTTGFDVEQDRGAYEGPFYIEPDCINLVAADSNKKYTIFVDNKRVEDRSTLKFNTTGRLGIQNTGVYSDGLIYTVSATARESAVDIDDIIETQLAETRGVTSINNITVTQTGQGATGIKLYVTKAPNAAITLIGTQIADDTMEIVVDGGTAFPHCFGTNDHIDTE